MVKCKFCSLADARVVWRVGPVELLLQLFVVHCGACVATGWDLEYNKVIRSYHGHLSGVYSLALHPTLDILITGGRDSVARVWDMRTKQQIHVLGGHGNTVASIITNPTDPQVITGSMDTTVQVRAELVVVRGRVTAGGP